LAELDAQENGFRAHQVAGAIRKAIERDKVTADQLPGWWAEWAVFSFHTERERSRRTWEGHFQPMCVFPTTEGGTMVMPPLTEATAETVSYWEGRAAVASHPILVARYSDAVWDLKKAITGERAHVDFARRAIDAYIAGSRIDHGNAWGESVDNLGRALSISMSVKDVTRAQSAVAAILEYVDRTADLDKIGTYLYLYEFLIFPKGLPVRPDQEHVVVERFESALARFSSSDVHDSPFRADQIGERLVAYYRRLNRGADATRVLTLVAQTFEAHALRRSAVEGLHLLQVARSRFVDAGQEEEVTRVQRLGQELAPRARQEMSQHTIEQFVPDSHREEFLSWLRGSELETGLARLVEWGIEDEARLKTRLDQRNREFPLQAMFGVTLLAEDGVRANVEDLAGDPDGVLVFELARWLPLRGIWLSWGLEDLIGRGLDTRQVVTFVSQSPLYEPARLPLIERGVSAHLQGDHVLAVHLLVPQIERALVSLIDALGGSSLKTHRTGRGVMQAKSINDALDDQAVVCLLGRSTRLHLVAVLSHPKGMNVRNAVSHGLLGPDAFTKGMSEWVLHALLVLGMIRSKAP